MKRKLFPSLLVLVAMVLVMLPAPLAAQDAGNADHPRAPRPDDAGLSVPENLQPEWSGTWQYGPDTSFQFTRFDGGYYPADGLVYFMGGRLLDGTTDGSVWSFAPADYVYADMGVDLVTPISNYTMNLLQDGAGEWGFYVFCGRTAAGDQSLSVQVYYPATNTAVQLDPADNYPGAVTCSSGVNAVYNNHVWLAGGFSGTANTAETWVFDPTAPVGSKWTQVASASLSIARAYIMGAVVDGKIYAIGGNYWDGSALINVVTVEVLDPNAPTPVWDDAAAADLPEVCSSSRAYGFDGDSPYTDPDGTPMAGRIVSGCGVWSDENEHVYVYDAAFNYWEPFPYINTDRRDEAGEFIPEAGGMEEFGMPALWMWGGRKDSDANVLVTSEYYDLVAGAAECDVLLVDDDWDFTADYPDSQGGRPFYTTALDALGITYDVWDTVSMGTPTFADMGPYQAVIWFTGYDWQTPVTAEEEAELILYLDNGGNVLMSNQEQNYAFGLTPLLTDYFWVDSITDDVTLLGTGGNPADPLYAALGPYAMDRPDEFGIYWPVDPQYVGPYDDEVYVKAGGFEPMLYTTDGAPNGTRFEGSGFRTVYLAYPVEWLTDVGARADVLGTALGWFCEAGPGEDFDLIPPGQTGSGVPGAAVDYTLTLLNNMGMDETFDLTYSSGWAISGPATVGPIPDGASQDFTVTVTVPPDAGCWDVDMAQVTAAAQSDPGLTDTAYIETTADPPGVGALQGHVYDLNTGDGLPEAYVWIGLGAYSGSTWTDGSGYYQIGDVPACTMEGQYTAYGYYQEWPVWVPIAAGAPTVYDISLTASNPVWSPPGGMSVTLPPGSTTTENLTIENVGSADLTFHLSEVPGDAGYPLADTIKPVVPHGVDPQVYADLAASPDGSTTFVVYMAEQADLSAAFAIKDRAARGRYVLDTLRATADRTQARLRASWDEFGGKYQSHYIINALVMEGNATVVNGIAALPEVGYIGPNTAVEAPSPVEMGESIDGVDAIVWNILQVNADDVWSTFGATGQGITVASIDTGVMYNHPALVSQYRGNLGGGTFDHNYNWWDPYGFSPTEPYDYHSHGSHTMGTMLGDDGGDNQIGMAPGATWFTCEGFDPTTGFGYTTELMTCGEFILAPWDLSGANPDPDLRADVVNNSWGGGQAQWWYNQIIYAWRAAGIFPAWSIGNDGPSCGTAGDPGDMANAIAAGATDSSDTIASFSSRGPALRSGITKPNIAAPGVNTISAYNNGAYGLMSGTSMASPHVAGEVALIWAAVPELRGDVQLTEWVIGQSALHITDAQCGDPGPPNNVYGWGRIDAFAAVTMADTGNWDIPWLSIDPEGGTVEPGGSTDVALTFNSTGLAPGTYSALLKVEFNDPYVTEVFYPVELTVQQGGEIELHINRTKLFRHPSAPWWLKLTAQLQVYDQNGAPVAGALMEGEWTLPDGSPVPGLPVWPETDILGRNKFHLQADPVPGVYQFCVTSITAAGYWWDPGDPLACMNIELTP
jgi:subtilisin family serine protease